MPDSTPPDRPSPASEEQVAEWLRLAEAATPGEWYVNDHYKHADDRTVSYDTGGVPCVGHTRYVEGPNGVVCETRATTRDVEFIAAARTAVPALAAALAAERAENERLRKLLRKAESNLDADKNRMLLNEIGTALLPAP